MERNGAEMVYEMAEGRQDAFFDYEPSITDRNMFCVYIGDLVKEVKTGKIWTVDHIANDFIVGKIGDREEVMLQRDFLWVATPAMPIGKGWK